MLPTMGAADVARRLPVAREGRRQRRVAHLVPCGERAEAQAARLLGDALQLGDGTDVEDVVAAHIAPPDAVGAGRIDIRAAGQHRHRLPRPDRQRLRKARRSEVGGHLPSLASRLQPRTSTAQTLRLGHID
jgi:hypothetical protein